VALILFLSAVASSCGGTHFVSDREEFCREHPAVDGGPPPALSSDDQRRIWQEMCGPDGGIQ